MDDLLMVHEGDALQDLLHEAHARPLSQHELVLDHPVEELSAADAGKNLPSIIIHQPPNETTEERTVSTIQEHESMTNLINISETRAALCRRLFLTAFDFGYPVPFSIFHTLLDVKARPAWVRPRPDTFLRFANLTEFRPDRGDYGITISGEISGETLWGKWADIRRRKMTTFQKVMSKLCRLNFATSSLKLRSRTCPICRALLSRKRDHAQHTE